MIDDHDKTLTVTFENIKETQKDALIFLFTLMGVCGDVGHSQLLQFYASGDGDFRPKVLDENGKYLEYPDYLSNKDREYLGRDDGVIDPDLFECIKEKIPITRSIENDNNIYYIENDYYIEYMNNDEYKSNGFIYHIGDFLGNGSGYYEPGVKDLKDPTAKKKFHLWNNDNEMEIK